MQRTQRRPSPPGERGERSHDLAIDCFLAVDARYLVVWSAKPNGPGPNVGQELGELCPAWEREDWNQYRRCMDERVAVHFAGLCPLTHERRDISAYPHESGGISIFSRPLPGAGGARESTVVPASMNTTRLRALLSEVMAELVDAVYLADAQGLHALNRSALSLAGYANAEELPRDFVMLATELSLRGRSSRQPLTLEQLPWSRALQGEAFVEELMLRPRFASSDRIVRATAAPLRLGHEDCAALCVMSDITQQTSAEADEKARADFEQRVIGIVSHDLRNPLQVIRFAASLGHSAARDDAKQSRQFERILGASARALRMVDDLLDFTRIRFTGALGIEVKRADVHALAEQAVNEAITTRPGRHIDLQTSGDGAGAWDPDRVLQILQNLVGNALQHTTEDTPVTVTTRGEEEQVVLEVHNGGPPIPEEDQRRLFEPFQRGRGPQARGGRSMGLGLYITAHLVHAHGGTVRLESNAENGTTFAVRLPRTTPQRLEGNDE